jgi:thioredoxin reductase (NADPH)
MFDWDVVIIGGGPAGLTAGLYLCRNKQRTILIEKELLGGPIMNYELIENYPGFSNGVSGAQLGSEMKKQAMKYGLQFAYSEVGELKIYSNGRYVKCADGASYMTNVVIVAGGSKPKILAVPGAENLGSRGIFYCALCDGGKFSNQAIAVCGGGDAGITEALYMTKIASEVIVIEAMPALTCSAILQERAFADPKMRIRCGTKIEAVLGDKRVEGVQIQKAGGQSEILEVEGILVHIGLEPNTSYLSNVIPLDDKGQIVVNERMETSIPYILAAGDIRSSSPMQISTAVGDGATAAITAMRILQELT